MSLKIFSIPYSISVLSTVSLIIFSLMGWVNSIVYTYRFGGVGSLSVQLVNSTYDSSSNTSTFTFKIVNDGVEAIKLMDINVNGLSVKSISGVKVFRCSSFEYDLGINPNYTPQNDFTTIILGKSTIYIIICMQGAKNGMEFTFTLSKLNSNSIINYKVSTN